MNSYSLFVNYIPKDFEKLHDDLETDLGVVIDSLVSPSSTELLLLTSSTIESTVITSIENYINNIYQNKQLFYITGDFIQNNISIDDGGAYSLVSSLTIASTDSFSLSGLNIDTNVVLSDYASFTAGNYYLRVYNKTTNNILKTATVSLTNLNFNETVTNKIKFTPESFGANTVYEIELHLKKDYVFKNLLASNLLWVINK